MFANKVLLITGGMGFGNAVLRRFLNTDIGAKSASSLVMRRSRMICGSRTTNRKFRSSISATFAIRV